MEQMKKNNRKNTSQDQKLKLSPSKARILNMSYPVLVEHYALVEHKKSKLSAAQRQYVKNRVKYLQDKGTISQAEIDLSMTFINNLIDANSGITLE